MLHGIGLRPISAQEGDFAHCDGRPKALPLDSTTLLEKGGRKTFVTKTGIVCAQNTIVRAAKSEDCELDEQSSSITPRATTAAADKKVFAQPFSKGWLKRSILCFHLFAAPCGTKK